MSTLSNPNILIFQLPGVGHQDRGSSPGRVETLRVFDQAQKIKPLLGSQLGGDAGTHKYRYCRYHYRYCRYYCRYGCDIVDNNLDIVDNILDFVDIVVDIIVDITVDFIV